MFELIVRVALASGAMATAGILGTPDFNVAWKASLIFAAYSYLVYTMEQRGLRNPGVSGLVAVADCGVLAVMIADMGYLAEYGAASSLPMLYAFWRHKANAAMMSPLVASWLLVGANLFGGGNAFTATLLVQALGVLVFGVVLSQARSARESRRERLSKIETPVEVPVQAVEQVATQVANPVTDDFLESYRALSDSARELERRGRRDRSCVQLFESATRQASSPFAGMASKLHDLTGAEGVCLHSVTASGDSLVLRGTAGNFEQSLLETEVSMGKRGTETDLVAAIEGAVSGSKQKFAAIVLKARGRIVGLLSIFHTNNVELEASVRRAMESAEFAGELMDDQLVRENDRRRMREAELLYTVATTTIGAVTLESLASRVARDLFESIKLDHVSIWGMHGFEANKLANEGTELNVLEGITFAEGQGVPGWLRSGAPLLSVSNARTDKRFPAQDAVRKRIGSVLVVPLEFGAEPFGYLVATTSKPNGIDEGEIETLRAVCAELSQAFARMTHSTKGPEGLASPREFFQIVQSGGSGHLVYIEVPNREELAETYGRPAIEHAIRRFAVRLRSELPLGASLTRRSEGDYVVFLPNTDNDFSQRWSNDIVTLASLVSVRTPDGKTKIPLALRAKVAPVNQQNDLISKEQVA